MIIRLIFFTALLFLASCAKDLDFKEKEYVFHSSLSSDIKSDKNIKISQIIQKLKDSKKSDKKLTFGTHQISSKVWQDKSNNFVKQYNYSHKEVKFYEYLPIISYFLPRYYNNYEVIIVFDKDNNILDVRSFSDEIKLKASIFCNEPKKSCVSEIY